jgi:hypothetical protein
MSSIDASLALFISSDYWLSWLVHTIQYHSQNYLLILVQTPQARPLKDGFITAKLRQYTIYNYINTKDIGSEISSSFDSCIPIL